MERCQEYPENKEGYKVIEEKASECCFSYRLVPSECQIEKCSIKPTTCEFYEDLISFPIDECCSTYECKCNKEKCVNVGKLSCPYGYEPKVIEDDKCCALEKCIKITIGNANGFESSLGSQTNVNGIIEGNRIIFGDDSDKDGEYPYGTFKATGDAKAASDAEAYAPFDAHGDFKGGDYYGKGGKQGMFVTYYVVN